MRRVKGSRGGLGGRGVSVRLKAGLQGGPGEGRKDGVTRSRETGRLKGGEETLLASPSLSLSLFISFLPPTYTPSDTHTHTLGGRL